MIIYGGIDPGKTGAISILNSEGKFAYCFDWPLNDEAGLRDIYDHLKSCDVALMVLEKAQSMPGQGVKSTASYMANFGAWKAFLAMAMWPHVEVHPSVLRRKFGIKSKKDGQFDGLMKARMRWPDAPLTRKKDNGRADALWLAEYGRMTHKGGV